MEPTLVDDDEWLYRAVRVGAHEYAHTPEGLRVSSAAFRDSGRRPSVDRDSLRDQPIDVRFDITDGVVKVLTRDVRAIGFIRVDPNDRSSDTTYTVDAIHRPLSTAIGDARDNDAHCQIESTPHFVVDGHFKRLREALAYLATQTGWVIPPVE